MGKDIYYEKGGVRIHNDDVFTTGAIRSGSVDLVITSPPYNIDIQYNSHNDRGSYEDYLIFSDTWMQRCHDWIRDDGRFCLNVPLDKNKGGQQSVGADLTTIAKKAGFSYHSTIIWNEGNISRRTAWGSWLSASAPYVIAPVELIVVLYKNSWKKKSGSRTSDITRDEFMAWTNGLWTFNGEKKTKIGHPAPFPVELPLRCMKLFSFVGDTVLDPFMGSGSTLVAASLCNRRGIGIEIGVVIHQPDTDAISFTGKAFSRNIDVELWKNITDDVGKRIDGTRRVFNLASRGSTKIFSKKVHLDTVGRKEAHQAIAMVYQDLRGFMQSLNQMEIDTLVFFARRREMETFQDSRVKTDGFIIRDLQEEIRSYFHLKEHVSLDRVSLVTNFMITKSSVSSDHYTYTLPEKFRYLIKPHKAIGDAARMFLVDREFHQFPEEFGERLKGHLEEYERRKGPEKSAR